MTDGWSIVESGFDVETNRAYEGLFTLGSGYLHVRGSLEEHLLQAPQNQEYVRMPANVTAEVFPDNKAKWGTYVPGVFGRHPWLNSEMVNLPWFLGLAPYVNGGKLDLEVANVRDHRRELDLRAAVLRRSVTWDTAAGAILHVTYEWFVSAARKHLCVQRMVVRTDRDVTVSVASLLDTDVRTNGHEHFTKVGMSHTGDPERPDLQAVVTTDTGDTVTVFSRVLAPQATWELDAGSRAGTLTGAFDLLPGQSLVVEKRTAVTTSRDLAPVEPSALLDSLSDLTYDDLLAEHTAVWASRWDAADVVIEGDARSQLAMRCSIYHLLRCHVPDDPRVAIDAKGAAGEAYFGRYFWDTEMNLLPFFLYTHPDKARTLADFRIETLDGARQNARGYGYPGARYAWESDARGIESCASWQYRDHEIHVTADIAYALAHYARATVDPAYLDGPAAELLVETARYWMARLSWRKGEDHPSLLGVMGPDEYCPISHNNSYTNRLVAHALKLASEHGQHGGASDEERTAFAKAAAGLPILRDPARKLVLQCEDFELLAEPDFDRTWTDRSKGYANNVSQERLYRTKALKQADVLMLMMLFPQEFSDEEVAAAWEYYLPYTTHDSSLSPGVHAILAARRLGKTDEAWAFWQDSAFMDLDGGAEQGIHIAGCGNNWQVAVFGFAGMSSAMHTDTLTLKPHLPPAWERLAFPIIWRGTPVYVDIVKGKARITNRGTAAIDASVAGERKTVPAGETAEFETR